MNYPVKWFTSAMNGAPRCSGTAGDLIALLDACLINGFNVNAVATLDVASNVATATFSVAHGYLQHQIVKIAGATPSGLNGDKRVLTSDVYTITFDATGIVDGTATGTIECRTAPVGDWEKTFEATQLGAYRSIHPDATGMYLRVDDSTATEYATVTAYETMSDIDTGIGWGKTGYWHKSNAVGTASRTWTLVGDGRIFYLFMQTYTRHNGCVFGDIISYKPGDAYHCILHTDNNDVQGLGRFAYVNLTVSVLNYSICRSYTQIGGHISGNTHGSSVSDYMGYTGESYPHPAGGGVLAHSPINFREAGNVTRGYFPGIYQPLQTGPLSNHEIALLAGGERIIAVSLAWTTSDPYDCRVFVDIGAWR